MVNTSPDNISINNLTFSNLSPNSDDNQSKNNYYINYIDDVSNEQLNMKDDMMSKSNIQQNSCQLQVSELIEEIYFDKNLQCEFECIFHEFDPEVIISYSKVSQRVYLTFSDPILASQVRIRMHGKQFHNKQLQISYSLLNSYEYLKPPKYERIYMQSPPTTPPIGWVAQREELPEINFDLFLALTKLQPNEPLEILPKQINHPAIIIHPCSDNDDEFDEIINPIIDEFGHKKYPTMDAKRRAQILHDAILVPDEQHIRQSAGDADQLLSEN